MKSKFLRSKERMKMVRIEQCWANTRKSIYTYIVCLWLGLSFVIQRMCGFSQGIFANPRIGVLANTCMIFGFIGAVIWLFVRPKKNTDKKSMSLARYIFNRIFAYAPLLFIMAEEIDLLVSTKGTNMPFNMLIVTLFFFIAFYDIDVNDFFLIYTIILCLVITGLSGKTVNLESRFTAVLFSVVIFIVEFIVDRYSYENALQRIDLETANDRMKRAVDDAVEELRKQTEKVEMIQNEVIDGLANLIEIRSGETGGHVKRTKDTVSMIAKSCMEKGEFSDILTDEYAALTERAAVLHDIGKISISDTILNAPRKLTNDEFNEMKKHTTNGGHIVSDILKNVEDNEYIGIAMQVALYHHERYDGTGYPEALKGENIPLCARIMAIADVYDALVSERCYKKPIPQAEALQIIKDGAGTQFDAVLVGIFLECMGAA